MEKLYNAAILKIHFWAEEMAWWVKLLPCYREDLCWKLANQWRAGVVAHVCNSSGERRGRDSRIPGSSPSASLGYTAESNIQERLSQTRWKEQKKVTLWPGRMCCGTHPPALTREWVHTLTHILPIRGDPFAKPCEHPHPALVRAS